MAGNLRRRWINQIAHRLREPARVSPTICFVCAFHGVTGATISIARTANLLAGRYRVIFVAPVDSDFNRMVDLRVQLLGDRPAQADLYIVDGQLPLEDIRDMRARGCRVLITAHGILPAGLKLEKIANATATHLVGEVQLMHHPRPPGRIFVISNYCDQVIVQGRSSNVGIVGRVTDPKKNVPAAISAALRSEAREIHVWGGPGRTSDARVVFHSWCSDTTLIYKSFGVLLSLSLEESFGLTVIEAMSAGIPCVLSNIPAHKQFIGCPGILVVDPNSDDAIVEALNRLLGMQDQLKPDLIGYWDQYYSRTAIAAEWYSKIDELLRA